MRQAGTLGLSLRNDSKSVSGSSKEIRNRVWWAICSVELRLAVMTGRPSAFTNTDFTVPLPIPVEEEFFFSPENSAFHSREVQPDHRHPGQGSPYMENAPPRQSPSSSSKIHAPPTDYIAPPVSPTAISPSYAFYFVLQTKLGLLTNEVLDQLYRPFVVTKSSAHVEGVISALSDKLEKWRFSLPSVFDFSKKQRDRQFARQRMSLGFFFYSAIILISRPCLCRVDPKIANLSGISGDFNRETRIKCVRAAKDMLDLLPNELSPINLYKVAPWWCLVHHLVQAATVSMLELSFRPDHHPRQVEETLQSAKKAVKFLRSMAEVDSAAHRAWGLCEDMLHKVANMVGQPFDSLPYGNLLDNSVGGGDGNSSTFDYPSYMPSAEAGNFGEFFAPFQPMEGLLHQEGLSQEGFSQKELPQAELSQAGFPQAGFPQAGFPQAGFPQAGFPQAGFLSEMVFSERVPPERVPPGRVPPGRVPSGRVPPGRVPPGRVPSGRVPPGRVPPGKVPSGKVLSSRPNPHF